ncbi:ATP-grasp fold amidoligase family protein [Ruania zhangjianzhongii]|uniref:ATP-grasp fold amidoligase family protein n=1 Tax=Ruania zhangjianzhongii TaxID=2603206 RepID=UPI0011CBEE6F|nr:ATP-grasp fold amidoligase family protein [Ruania zhangjianzhongii]
MTTEPGRTRSETSARAEERLTTLRGRLKKRLVGNEVLQAQIDVLSAEVKTPAERQATGTTDPEHDPGKPSYALSARFHRRANTTGVNTREGLREPILDLYTKTAGRAFAAAHGIQIPAELGRWADPDAVDWDSLPERFVLKSSRGGGGISVFPLERTGDGFIDRMLEQPVTPEEVTAKLWKKHKDESVYIAEEFLQAKSGEPGQMPHDIKVFCFYGEPAFIEVRTGDWSRARETEQRLRTFLPDGTELTNVRALISAGTDVKAPEDFEGVAQASRILSQAIRRPIQRIDFYETDRGIVFGEITQNPGRPPSLVPEWDEKLGAIYENAYARLLADLADEGALGVEYGDQKPA